MGWSRWARRVAIPAALVVMLFATAAGASHSWGGYHWGRKANPFTLRLGDNVSTAWDSYLRTTSTDWTKSTVLDTTVVAGVTTPRTCKPALGRVEVCSDRYGANGWLGIAQVWVSGGHITQGTVKMNDTYFNTAKYNTVAWRNLVMCQEVGHTFGLAHQDENFNNTPLGSCMDYSSDPTLNQHPNQHDYDQLVAMYSHLDAVSTVGAAPASNPQGGKAPATWGQLVRGSEDHGVATFRRNGDGGEMVFTFVIWA